MRMVTGKPGSNHDLKGLEPARTIPLEDHWERRIASLRPLNTWLIVTDWMKIGGNGDP